MKYTLFCLPGKNFRADVHCLLLGKWLQPKENRLILIHGILPDQKVLALMERKQAAVFKDNRYHTLSIESGYDPAYIKRLKGEENSQQFCGYLLQQSWNDRIFLGGIYL